ncbi:hypothetical protein [Mucilaginibacter celer]|uniref:Uncharacterized protein n=1 Tax=Mucilaginibacter celer TaxID=2305508 RepID=A0A494VZ14_9SPHI|nr:hypothetical protein [Mucilaginibacter celer]AYL96385.1 hypothetical protein HYN43_014250 [Mucilaginibacter celer]
MEPFLLNVGKRTYKVIPSVTNQTTFSVINYSSFYTIARLTEGYWEIVEHRFGDHSIPLQEIGRHIEEHCKLS